MKALLTFISSFMFAAPALAHGMSEADKAKILDAGLMEYVELGATHMLSGYDHLLFLFGVIFFLTKFKDIVKFITAFTIGHSITLIFATIYGIQANYYLVDAVIALTVCYKGFDNLEGFKKYLNVKAPNLLWMVFGFGLIHGFGLSTRLQQLPLHEDGLILDIIAFNVGVELGQIIALALMLVVLSGWRHLPSFKKFSNAANAALIFVGFMLLLMQLHGYTHTTGADGYPLNKDDHYHVHQEWGANESIPQSQQAPTQETVPQITPTEPSPHRHGDGKPHAH